MGVVVKSIQKTPYDFSIEKPTQSISRNLLIEQSNEGLKVSVQEFSKTYQIQRCFIGGLPKLDLVPKDFFDSCYATISNSGSNVHFHLRMKGGGQQHSTNRQGAQLTRNAQKIMSFGGRTEQEVQEEIKDIVKGINQICTLSIEKVGNLPKLQEIKTNQWKDLNKQIDVFYKKEEIDGIIKNIDERFNFIKKRKEQLKDHLNCIYGVLDVLSDTKTVVSNEIYKGENKKREIENIRKERIIFG